MTGSLTPERHRVISVRHWLLCVCKYRTGCSPVQIKNNIHSMIEYPLHEVSDRIDVVLPTILRLNPVDTEPALFIQGNPHSIGIPILNVLNHIVVIRSIEYTIAIHTLELGA